ncbi:unnamed protein product [Cyprideis torosa]|uniref:Protein quiver n=1 Tax=Cyprideis torosa TaxID=163714 RepID=A0A7R8ZQK9_9CRUS|nr:unnamed protein product [Cyprideis torosa]CAG0896645.1 unnamed protein product [Cyprideis torosa]
MLPLCSSVISTKSGVSSLFVLTVTILFAIQQGHAIKCWKCNSYLDPKCKDPFNNLTLPLTNCDELNPVKLNKPHLYGLKPTMCRKIRQKVYGQWRYIRDCAYFGETGLGGDERYCMRRSGTWNIHIEYCHCKNKDGCNSAHSLRGNYSWVFGVAPLLFLTWRNFLGTTGT